MFNAVNDRSLWKVLACRGCRLVRTERARRGDLTKKLLTSVAAPAHSDRRVYAPSSDCLILLVRLSDKCTTVQGVLLQDEGGCVVRSRRGWLIAIAKA